MVAEATLVDPIPVSDESPAPKRGRGRPPKLNPDGTRVNAPKVGKPQKPKATKPRSASRTSRSLRPQIGAFLTMVNSAVLMSPLGTRPMAASYDPKVEPEKLGDELDAAEIDALAGAIDMQCQRSPRFRKYIERMLTAGSGGQLFTVLGIIAARRAARHGIIPQPLDFTLGMALTGSAEAFANAAPPATPTAPDMVTGEYAPNRDNIIDYENIGTFAEP
jgi:hypothetical protein